MISELGHDVFEIDAVVETLIKPDQVIFVVAARIFTENRFKRREIYTKKFSLLLHVPAKGGGNIDRIDIHAHPREGKSSVCKASAIFKRPHARL